MQFNVFLNRFDKDKAVIEKKFSDSGIMTISEKDNSLIVECSNVDKILSMQETAGVFKIVTGWKPLNFKRMNEDCLKAVSESGKKIYKIQTKFLQKIKISAKSVYKHINPYLKHEGFVVSEDKAEVILYVEFMKAESEIMYRVSYSLDYWHDIIGSAGVSYLRFVVVIENPSIAEEVSDFLRLCWIFKMKLYVVTKNRDFAKLLKKAKGITKGIDYNQFELEIRDKFPAGYVLAGFSKLARENEIELKEFFKKEDRKIALVFGDDKFGLTQESRNKMDYMFRLTPEIKKPLRASQALSYILGFFTRGKV